MGFPVKFIREGVRPDPVQPVFVHPATLPVVPKLYEPIGAQVAVIPVEKLLPDYWLPRKSQLGIVVQKPDAKAKPDTSPVSLLPLVQSIPKDSGLKP